MKYNFNYFRLADFKDNLSPKGQSPISNLIEEGRLAAKTSLQATADAASRGQATGIIMRCESWLHSLGFPREVQNTIENLPFDKSDVFSERTFESLHVLKD